MPSPNAMITTPAHPVDGGWTRHRGAIAVSTLVLTVLAFGLSISPSSETVQAQANAPQVAARPNILWLTSEDNGPQLGAYGDAYATTPNIDKLASRGYRYTTAWSNGPVCAAARTTLITGVYPESTGGEHMRSVVRLPESIRLYPTLLREAGYYVTNNAKTDYNYPGGVEAWNESSATAHWKNRAPGQPFFAVFNIDSSHESQVQRRPREWVHDVDKAPVPPYMPNVRETREDWAAYYDNLTVMDAEVGRRLAELEAAGLTEDTIVMYYGDHGPGLARSKRVVYNSGLRVPLVVYVPARFRSIAPPEAARPGSASSRLVSFVDLAPTVLSLAGVQPPAWMQGRAFMGRYEGPANDFLFGFRGRMDERYDLSRSVRDQRYIYLRNYMPHRPHGQHAQTMMGLLSAQAWKRLFDEGKLDAAQAAFWQPKPSEELYDLQEDQWEVRNLATSAAHSSVLARMRTALNQHARAVRDVGFLPEYELQRSPNNSPYVRGQNPSLYDFDAVYRMAQQASDRSVSLATIRPGLTSRDPIVRYWAATGIVVRGKDATTTVASELQALLADPEPGPRIAAAEALARFGPAAHRQQALDVLMQTANTRRNNSGYVSHLALYTLNQLSDLTAAEREAIQQIPVDMPPAGELRGQDDYRNRLKVAISRGVR